MLKNRIVRRSQAGKLMISPEKRERLEKEIAYHLGCLKRGFESGELDENLIENADETHFVINMDNGKALGFIGDESISYADVLSGGDPMTMMVTLTGGPRAAIQPLFFKKKCCKVLSNQGSSIQCPPGVSYISSPKGWMDSKVWYDWLSEPRAMPVQFVEKKRTLFVDNCSSHNENETIEGQLETIKLNLRKFPSTTTGSTQPADSFVIQKIKDRWRFHWEKYKFNEIKEGRCTQRI